MAREIDDPQIDVETQYGYFEINQPQEGVVENGDGL